MTAVVFAPVSGPNGMGEYARCLTLAQALQRRWPQIQIHFLLNRDTPYAHTTPFETHLLRASITLSGDVATQLLQQIRPRLVVFDNAGRRSHLQAARALGARIVYISSRRKQRRKAFQLRWMPLLDEHWLAYPQQLFGPLTPLERLKLRLLHRPRTRFLDALLAPRHATTDTADRDAVTREGVLFVPGGGSSHPGARDLPQRFLDAARAVAAQGKPVQFVAGPSFTPPVSAAHGLELIRAPTGERLMSLLAAARLVVVNGGDTLLQALVLGKPCLAVPIAPDQAARVRWLHQRGIVATADSTTLAAQVLQWFGDAPALAKLTENTAGLHWHDSLPVAVDALCELLDLPSDYKAVVAAADAVRER